MLKTDRRMRRPVVFDLTHLARRARVESPAGIDRVDLGYARSLVGDIDRVAAATHYGRGQPWVLLPAELTKVVRRIESKWGESSTFANDANYVRSREWILGRSLDPSRSRRRSSKPGVLYYLRQRLHLSQVGRRGGIPENSTYLNVSQHGLEHPIHFKWLAHRRDQDVHQRR